jgi:hypothetical protein
MRVDLLKDGCSVTPFMHFVEAITGWWAEQIARDEVDA